MSCEHLSLGKPPLCAVVQGLMHPSLSEMGAYCTSDDCVCCALYQQYESRGEKVPLETAAVLTASAP
jgi:hypothetical protein